MALCSDIGLRLKLSRESIPRAGEMSKPLTTRKRVLKYLEHYPVIRGPLDISDLVSSENSLSDEELCDFITHYANCGVLVLRHWKYLSDKFLRTASITMGTSLLDLDVSYSDIQSHQVEILFSHLFSLTHLRMSQCHHLDSLCFRTIVLACHKSLQLLYMDHNPSVRHEALLYISGEVGLAGPKLSHLKAIDLSNCPLVEDKSLLAMASASKRLRHLNLQCNDQLGDIGLIALIRNNCKLELVNVSGCSKISSLALFELGSHCPHLQSLNASRCSRLNDDGVIYLARGCRKIQAISLAGIRNISEVAICALAENCPGLMMLNVTGYTSSRIDL